VASFGVGLIRGKAVALIILRPLEDVIEQILNVLARTVRALGDVIDAITPCHHQIAPMRHSAPSRIICSWAALSWSNLLRASSNTARSSSVRRGSSSARRSSASLAAFAMAAEPLLRSGLTEAGSGTDSAAFDASARS